MPASRPGALHGGPVPSIFNPFEFWITPAVGGAPYKVDLTPFAVGEWDEERYAGDFEGRPGLATGLAMLLKRVRPPEISYATHIQAFRTLFRFLQSVDPDGEIQSSADLTDAHGHLLDAWLARFEISAYKRIKPLITALRKQSFRPALLWPPEDMTPAGTQRASIEVRTIARLFTAFRLEAEQVKRMFAAGTALADAGRDPRRAAVEGQALWRARENHAWLAREILVRDACDYPARCVDALPQFEGVLLGPDYLPPTSRRPLHPTEAEKLFVRLRWFSPGFNDTALFLWMFLLKTGWNVSTALSLDVSDDWAEDDQARPGFKSFSSFKARAGRVQRVSSKSEPEWHPFRIVQFMVDQTEPLRAVLRARLAEAKRVARKDRAPSLAKVIEEMKAALRSPWIYHDVGKGIEIGSIANEDCARLNGIARSLVRNHGLRRAFPRLESVKTSDARHAWISYAYESSGFDVTTARIAGGHASATTTHVYIRTRHLRRAGEARFRAFQNAAFREIASARPLNATRLRLLVENGKITEEQERRLLDLSMRTRVGMGCKDAQNPPPKIAPSHQAGELCAVQRCTGCKHGVVFDDSLPDLARRFVELRLIQERLPLASWLGSSFEAEANSIEATLTRFHQDRVEAVLREWADKFERGEVLVQDTFPGR